MPHYQCIFSADHPIFCPYRSLELRTSINSPSIARPSLLDIWHHQLLDLIYMKANCIRVSVTSAPLMPLARRAHKNMGIQQDQRHFGVWTNQGHDKNRANRWAKPWNHNLTQNSQGGQRTNADQANQGLLGKRRLMNSKMSFYCGLRCHRRLDLLVTGKA